MRCCRPTLLFPFLCITESIIAGTIIVQWNCRSLHQRTGDLASIIEQCRPDIICLSETWMDETFRISFPGFSFALCNRNRHGGGVAIMIRRDIHFQVIDLNIFDRAVRNEVGVVCVEIVSRGLVCESLRCTAHQGARAALPRILFGRAFLRTWSSSRFPSSAGTSMGIASCDRIAPTLLPTPRGSRWRRRCLAHITPVLITVRILGSPPI